MTTKLIKTYDEEGYLISDRYYNVSGQPHREDGPAVVIYDDDGENVYIEEWWINGEMIKREYK